jgi:predicted GTPase
MDRERILILGAAGKDFHVFNMVYRENANVEVIAFTATQIPDISDRKYPPILAGELYPNGIDILDETHLSTIIKESRIDTCVFAYSDVEHNTVMNLASIVNANGADFKLLSMDKTMLKTNKIVISIVAVRTGVGKSQTSRYITNILKETGLRVAVIPCHTVTCQSKSTNDIRNTPIWIAMIVQLRSERNMNPTSIAVL